MKSITNEPGSRFIIEFENSPRGPRHPGSFIGEKSSKSGTFIVFQIAWNTPFDGQA